MTDEQKLKMAFAEAWLRKPNNAYAAAMSVTRNDSMLAVRICDAWIFDNEVLAFKEQLIADHGEDHFLPTKFEMAQRLLERAENATEDGFTKMYKLVADMRGFIEKPGVTINNTQTNNRVMVIPVGKLNHDGSVNADDWEQQAIEQQQALIE